MNGGLLQPLPAGPRADPPADRSVGGQPSPPPQPAAPVADEVTGSLARAGAGPGGTTLPDAVEQRRQVHTTAVMQRVGETSPADLDLVNRAVAGARLLTRIEWRDHLRADLARQGRRGMGIAWYAGPAGNQHDRLQREIGEGLAALGLADEVALHRLIDQEVPDRVLATATRVAAAMLDQNEAVARREQRRYGLESPSDQAGLLAADRRLASLDRRSEIAELRARAQVEGDRLRSRGMGIATLVSPLHRSLERAEVQQRDVDRLRGLLGLQYPILLAEGYRPGMFAGADPTVLRTLVEGPAGEVLENIAKVRVAIAENELKVWHVPNAVAMAQLALGVAGHPALTAAVDARVRSIEADATFWAMVKAALAITTTILAGMLLSPATGALVGAAWGTESLLGNISRYRMESAAERTSLDPVLADLSVNEPELLWIVLDVVGLGLDLAVVTKGLRVAARGVLRHPDVATLARLDEAAAAAGVELPVRRRLGQSVAQRFGVAAGDLVELTPQTRRVAVRNPALLAEYERLANSRMRAVIADVLAGQASTPARRRLAVLLADLRQLMARAGTQPLTAAQRQAAEAVLREARDLARADFGSVRTAMWRRLRADPDLQDVTRRMAAAGDVELGARGGSVRIRTVADDGRVTFQALEPDHLVRLSDNPWRYNDPRNLVLTDSAQNQQFLETLRQQGSIWATDDIERFVVGNGLVDQSTIHLPGARGAAATATPVSTSR